MIAETAMRAAEENAGSGDFLVGHMVWLGVNAVELLPIAEFEARANWGYGTSHFFATDQAAGGTDRLKMFIKACHRRGIAVILDVCYNHFDPDGERAEWAYDCNDPTRNIYYWYEGKPSDYSDPSGGYIRPEMLHQHCRIPGDHVAAANREAVRVFVAVRAETKKAEPVFFGTDVEELLLHKCSRLFSG